MRKLDVKIIKNFKTLKRAAAVIFAVLMLTGCVNLLEDYRESITEHQLTPYVRPPVEQTTVSDYEEFLTVIIRSIMLYETDIHLLYYNRDGDEIDEDIIRARQFILNVHPVGAYIVADISARASRIVTHFEVNIEIEYKRTKEQLESIVTVTSELSFLTRLRIFMRDYEEIAVFRTRLQLNEKIIADFVRDTYYNNPHLIVLLPMVTIEIFPEIGSDRIYELQFGYLENPRMLQYMSGLLMQYIQQNAELAIRNTDAETLLTLVDILMETTFNEGAARTIHAHGVQNFAATAYGALVRGSAVGEGFAMAFKALADELGFDCRVVLGELDGMIHAWNIISLYGDFYHVDVAMCVLLGKEVAFLKTDADFEGMLYTWDRENTVRCEGPLTLEDILPDNENSAETDELDEEDEEEDFIHEGRKRVL